MNTCRFKKLAPVFLLAAAAGLGVTAPARAAYPDKPIKLIVPFTAGGPTDALARIVGAKLTQSLGQTVIVENRGGAGGLIGTEAAASAAPDGYTLFFATTGTMTINPSLYSSMRIKPLSAFDAVGMVAGTVNVLVVPPSLHVKTTQELIALAKKKPGALTFGSAGVGSSNHLSGELFKKMAGIDIVHVPYKGSAPALTDLLGGRISMMFDTISNEVPNIETNKVIALGVTGTSESPTLPHIPTIAEAGLPGFHVSIWFGLVAPHGIAPETVHTLNQAINKMLANPDMQSQLASLGATPLPGSPGDFTAQMKKDEAKWSKIIKDSGVKVD
ncbi:tripartite tricarboxylate transporter substrate binding protein [Paralcaligenes ginsengisoli]